MFSNPKTRRPASLRRLRRSGLAALLITCGAFGTVNAEDEGAGTAINLRLLPPLPVGIGQLELAPDLAAGQQRLGVRVTTDEKATATQIRTNPYAKPASSPRQQSQVMSTPQQSTAVLRQVGGFTQILPENNDSAARLIRPTESTFSLKPLKRINAGSLHGAGTAAAPASAGGELLEAIDQLPEPANEMLEPMSKRMEPAEHADTMSARAHFSLSDEARGDVEPVDAVDFGPGLWMNDPEGPVVLDAAPLLEVATPTMLRAAEPVLLALPLDVTPSVNESTPFSVHIEDGDVRSATGRMETRRQQVAPHEVTPLSLDEHDPLLNSTETSEAGWGETLATTPEDSSGFERIPSSQLPVPQVYRPKQSLVIDVPTAKPSIDTVSAEGNEEPRSLDSDPIFSQEIADVIPVRIAQSQAFTPSEPMRRVQLENRDICEAVLVGNHKLLLIGRSQGATRLAIWCGEETEAQLYEIQVVSGHDATPGSSLDAIAKRLTETITATYPSCQVRVVPHDEGLAVNGRASDTKSAREILRLVRSACLKSVSDRLEVR